MPTKTPDTDKGSVLNLAALSQGPIFDARPNLIGVFYLHAFPIFVRGYERILKTDIDQFFPKITCLLQGFKITEGIGNKTDWPLRT